MCSRCFLWSLRSYYNFLFVSSNNGSLFIISTILFFFFKQKTAYEMRISDWSSDVCSSDLVIDRLVFDYYGLDDSDVAIVEDTVHSIIPAMQPRRSAGLQRIWTQADSAQRAEYDLMLLEALSPHFRVPVKASLAALSQALAVLKLSIGGGASQPE